MKRKKTGGRNKGTPNKKTNIYFGPDQERIYKKDLKEKPVLYFFRLIGTDFYKVGISSQLRRRLLGISSANPHKIHLLKILEFNSIEDAEEFESIVLESLKAYSVKGEWLKFDETISEMVQKINSKKDAIELNRHLLNKILF
jgi:hypothetical protein